MSDLLSPAPDTCTRLVGLLDAHDATYRVIDHMPEGRTDIVSSIRGHDLSCAAKCLVIAVKEDKETRYVLAVVPGDRRVDIGAVKRLFGARYAAFATLEAAERLSASVSGSIPPFSFDDRLELVVDRGLLDCAEIYFNAGRLDRSLALSTADYLAIANPRVEAIAQAPSEAPATLPAIA
jgi:Ala-tRNA(Pro) deacylase